MRQDAQDRARGPAAQSIRVQSRPASSKRTPVKSALNPRPARQPPQYAKTPDSIPQLTIDGAAGSDLGPVRLEGPSSSAAVFAALNSPSNATPSRTVRSTAPSAPEDVRTTRLEDAPSAPVPFHHTLPTAPLAEAEACEYGGQWGGGATSLSGPAGIAGSRSGFRMHLRPMDELIATPGNTF
ncbi:uncharacterized protein AMSG_11636 [Thecamonas trahens ATCC 50062]|uniref:Uncharacterized protein n=1 Tax=Thecamonas trahens ATCC 50062 TaxID=461836 RepID=A0A0L0DLI8_THETB|nr:hypothetical protein AMSG_11636 [Thecamonas trahens ATCC 50062]KNC52263.1 hypothetical protein AMSG_11636 [Thecamonas trahens ATCC 50062]|eukprot:XP_013762332.1 hypothetical protein AMSG_11636 [Thecamonas trahens ATCC 50062]